MAIEPDLNIHPLNDSVDMPVRNLPGRIGVALKDARWQQRHKGFTGDVGGEYCPLPYIESDISSFLISSNQSSIFVIEGFALDQVSAVNSSGASISILSASFTALEIEVSASIAGDYDLILEGVCGQLTASSQLRVRDISFLLPGDNTNWVRQSSGVVVGSQSLSGSASSGWNKGASFGTVPAGQDFELSFKVDNISNVYGMIGMDNADPNHNYNTIDYALYVVSGGSLNIYENGASRGNVGSVSIGDTLQVKRTGATISYHKNQNPSPLYTSGVSSSLAMVFDSSIYRNLSLSEISLWHTN